MNRTAGAWAVLAAVLVSTVNATALVARSARAVSAGPGRQPSPQGDRRGAELSARVLARQQTSGFRIRARIVRQADRTAAAPLPINLRVLGRTDRTGTRVLFQVLWPAAVAGYALNLEYAPGADGANGFLLEPPDRVTPLDGALRVRPFLDTGLLIDDFVEDFWRWPSQRHAGEARMDGNACEILESRPAPGTASPYSMVRSWIVKSRSVPVRVRKYGHDGVLLRRFDFAGATRGNRDDGLPARLVIERAGGASSATTIEFFASQRDIDVPAAEFDLARLKQAASAGRHGR
jgi:hypothetical protein